MSVKDLSQGGHISKRSRLSGKPSPFLVDQESSEHDESQMSPLQYNPLDEPRPVGLRLNKSPSFLELIEKKLSEEKTTSKSSENPNSRSQKYRKRTTTTLGANEKLKASNFTASLLRIGSWEYMSSYENDLVAKCYFAKQKLVWEVLEGGLKSKIEIQWSDIVALKATCSDDIDHHGTLNIVLSRPPIFFKETNPQPRKHTLWKQTSDFTNGQATTNRTHFLQCPPGVLNKHYEKLIQCDMRLYILSQQPEMVIENPYFDHVTIHQGYSPSGFAQSPPLNFGQNPIGETPQYATREAPPSSPVMMDNHAIQWNESTYSVEKRWEQMNVPNLGPSKQASDLVNQSDRNSMWDAMENIKEDLLCDTQCATNLDERSLLKKVDSLNCLLQDPALKVDQGHNNEGATRGIHVTSDFTNDLMCENTSNDILEPSNMARIDSFGEFELHLPHITSLSKF